VIQNYGSSGAPLIYYVFDLLVLAGKDIMGETLETRRGLLEDRVLSELDEPIGYSPELKADLATLIHSVKAQGLSPTIHSRSAQIEHRAFLVNWSVVALPPRWTASLSGWPHSG
jgi:hypothetical protein